MAKRTTYFKKGGKGTAKAQKANRKAAKTFMKKYKINRKGYSR